MRQHYEHLAAALGFLALAVFVSWYHTGPLFPVTSLSRAGLVPLPDHALAVATTSVPAFDLSTSTLEALLPGVTVPPAATSTRAHATTSAPFPARVPPASPAPTRSTPPPSRVPTATTAIPAPLDGTGGELAALKGSIVNILCVSHVKPLRSTSGSGVIIDSRGLILTVAHVAQSLLLERYLGSEALSCTVRTGSPAASAYTALPVYVSEQWVRDNPTTLISSQPTGTGEHDYALIAIAKSAGKPVQASYPAISLATEGAHAGDQVYIGSYGAQELTAAQVRSALAPTLATSTVAHRYTFTANTPDVLSIAGSPASQEGSSGGAVVNGSGELIGLIVTSDVTGDVYSREMRVITPEYIRRSFTEDTGKDFDSYFSNTSIDTLESVYVPTAEKLGAFIAHAIGIRE